MLDKTNFFSWLQFITAINDMQEKYVVQKKRQLLLRIVQYMIYLFLQ